MKKKQHQLKMLRNRLQLFAAYVSPADLRLLKQRKLGLVVGMGLDASLAFLEGMLMSPTKDAS